MRYLLGILLAIDLLAAQEVADTTALDTTDARSNAYIHEDWSYFAERLRNEFLALGEKKYRRGEFQAAVMEYFSFLYHFPEDELVPLVHYRIGRAYERLKEFDLARQQYTAVRDSLDADPLVKVVCLRQLARMDYELGDYQAVLNLPPMEDPYILVLKGFASLTMENWTDSEELFRQAYRFYPPRAQKVLDSLITDIEAIPELRYYRGWKRSFWNLLPGGGLLYLGSLGEALGYAIGTGTLAMGAAIVPHWTRYVMGLGAVGVYMVSFKASKRLMEDRNLGIREARLVEINQAYSLDTFWSFAHPAIY
ncbi:MAG: tol-pal system YbgF family protein [Candidatus Neomarinimicrobiota bacterium]